MRSTIQSFYKLVIGFILLFGIHTVVYSQNCEIHANVTPATIFCGQEAILSVYASGDGTVMMDEDFNSGSFGTGWSSTPGSVMWNNPCSSNGVDGTTHAWMGNSTSVPRDIVTTNYDLTAATAGVTICFDLFFATQGNASPCEGPDEPDEGVYLQYSIDGGANWITINYFDPEGGYNTPYTQWNNWCFSIPAAAITSNTQFRWHQDADSGQDYDHWGIDNVQIVQNDVNAVIVWGSPGDSYYYDYGVGSPGGENPIHVSPISTTTYDVKITTGTGDVCVDQVTVTVVDPVYEVDIDVSPTPLCVGDCANITGSAVQVIDPGGVVTFDQNELNPVGGFGAGSIGADVNINVQGINTSAIYDGLIQEVCIHNFTYWATGFTIGFPPQQVNIDISDFSFKLKCPDGSEITLIPQGSLQPSTSGGSLNAVCFVPVGGATDLGSQTQPYSGTYDPADSFSDLNGCNPNGVWTIEATAPSGIAVGVGNFSGWSITFDNPPIHGPVTATWSPSTGLTPPTITDANNISTVTCPTSNASYDITVSNGVAGCATHTETIQIVVSPCLPCTPPNLIINNLQDCSSSTIDLNTAIDPTSDAATITFYNSQADANSATNAINSVVTSSGSYWVRAEDPSDATCYVVEEIQVTVTTVTYTTSTSSPTCGNNDGEIIITPDAGFTITDYSIDNGATTQTGGSFSNLGANTYTILITDVNNCTATGTIILNNTGSTDDPSFSLTDFCKGAANNATITGTTGGTFSIITPTGDGTTIDASTGEITNGVSGTTYTVQYKTNSACPVTETHDVTIHLIPTYTLTANDPTCGNSDGEIVITPDAGFTIIDYSIDNGATTQTGGTFSSLSAGSFLIYVKDNNGCEATGTKTLNNTGSTEDASFTLLNFCKGAANNATINGTTGGTFSITSPIGDGAIIDASTGEITNGIGGTTYTIQYKTNGTCPAIETQDVTVYSLPTYTVATTDPTCGNSDGAIVVTPGIGVTITDYSIDNGTTTQSGGTFSNLSAGSFMIYVKDNNGCEATGTEILNNTGSTDNASFTLTNFCEESANSATVTGTIGGTFSILSPTGDGATINPTTGEITDGIGGTTYTIQYQTSGSCPTSSTQQVTVKSTPNVSFTAMPAIGIAPLIVEFENTTTNANSFIWDFGDGNTVPNNNNTLSNTYDNTGSYVVILTGENDGCIGMATTTIVVLTSTVEYAFPNVFTPNGDGKNDEFMLINPLGVEEISIIVVNRWGNLVFEGNKTDFKWNGKVKNTGADCADGTYFYKAAVKDFAGNEKIEHGFVQLNRGK